MAGTIFDDIDQPPTLGPDPSEEFQGLLAEKTPENDESARLAEKYDVVDEQIIEADKVQTKVEALMPPQDTLRFDMLPRNERIPYYRNIPYLEEGDITAALDLNEVWNGDRQIAGIVDDIKGVYDVGARSWELTAERNRQAEEAADVLNKYTRGELGKDKETAKETFEAYRTYMREQDKTWAAKFKQLQETKKKLGTDGGKKQTGGGGGGCSQ